MDPSAGWLPNRQASASTFEDRRLGTAVMVRDNGVSCSGLVVKTPSTKQVGRGSARTCAAEM